MSAEPGWQPDPALEAKRAERAAAAEKLAALRAQQEAAARREALAAEFGAAPWLAASAGVPPELRSGLAEVSAGLVVSGTCSPRDFEVWGWGASTRPGRAGEWFTYCRVGTGDRRIYADPATGEVRW